MNGGMIGLRSAPGVDRVSGVWSMQELADATRLGVWPPDPYFSSVVALLHMDGGDASTTFTDVKGHTFTPVGNAQIDTAQSKFGGASGLFDGAGDYISASASADWGFGAGDWTVEAWVRPTDAAGDECLFDNRLSAATGCAIYTSLNSLSNTWGFANNSAIVANGGNLTAGGWAHLAVTRSGNTVRGFRGGTVDWTYTDSRTYASSPAINICASGSGQYFTGHVDDLRITKGVARYTANFTPPTFPFVTM